MNDGGPAFPVESPSWSSFGMSLRDYFAAAALTSIGLGGSGMSSNAIAELAYILADAMLAVREKP